MNNWSVLSVNTLATLLIFFQNNIDESSIADSLSFNISLDITWRNNQHKNPKPCSCFTDENGNLDSNISIRIIAKELATRQL